MRNAHARHKLNTYSYTMRVKEVVKLTAPTCIGKRRKSKKETLTVLLLAVHKYAKGVKI